MIQPTDHPGVVQRWVMVRGMPVRLTVLDLACCGVESALAIEGIEQLEDAAQCAALAQHKAADELLNVVVIAGTVTAKNRDLVRAICDCPDQRVIAFGACAISGGPYWDSYAVEPGWMPVDLVVPGCAPPAEALIDALETVVGGVE